MRDLVLLAAALAVCPPALAQQPAPRVEELWSTRGPRSAPFAYVAGMVELADGAVVISDTDNQTLYRFQPAAGSFKTYDRRGKGPGELQTPTLVTATPAGEIALYDLGRKAILHYDAALRPVKDVLVSGSLIVNPKGFVVLADGTSVISGGQARVATSQDTAFALHHFGRDGKLLASYFPLPVAKDRYSLLQTAGGPLTRLPGGGFLYSNSAPHQIVRFAADMTQLPVASDRAVLEPIVERFAVDTVYNGRPAQHLRWFYDQSRGIFPRADGRLLNVITRQYRGDSVWELWTAEGKLVRRWTVPRAYRPLAMTRSGDILAVRVDPETDEHIVVALRLTGV